MRTRKQELEHQIIDIFNEFYKEKLEQGATCFVITATELDGMISINDINDKDGGTLQHDGDFIWRFAKNKFDRYELIFMKVQNGVG